MLSIYYKKIYILYFHYLNENYFIYSIVLQLVSISYNALNTKKLKCCLSNDLIYK